MSRLSARQSTIALVAVSLSSLMFGLEISSVPMIVPTLEQTLHADFVQLQWIMNAYTIAVATVLMAAGAIADRYGRRRTFLVSITAFGLTSLVCGLTSDASVLIVARFLQGLAGGFMLICQVAILSHQFQGGRERGFAFGWWGIIFGIGLGFGPIVGSAIVALASWPWVFLVHVGLSIATFGLVVLGVQESRDPKAQRLDVPGVATLSLAVFALTYFITQGPRLGFGSPTALAILATAIASGVAFVIVELRAAHPMFDFAVFRIPSFSGALIGSVGMNFSFWPLMIYLPIWFQAGLGYDNVGVGLALLAYTLPTLFTPPLAERLSLKYGPGRIIPAGLFVIGLGLVSMTLGAMAAYPSWLTMLPGLLLGGVGLGLTNTPVTNTSTASVSSDRAGMASGMDMSARMITLAINIALMGAILFNGVLAHLKTAPSTLSNGGDLAAIAERIAAGNVLGDSIPPDLAHAALTQGFGWVMLYGGLGCWVLAASSFIVFQRGRRVASA